MKCARVRVLVLASVVVTTRATECVNMIRSQRQIEVEVPRISTRLVSAEISVLFVLRGT